MIWDGYLKKRWRGPLQIHSPSHPGVPCRGESLSYNAFPAIQLPGSCFLAEETSVGKRVGTQVSMMAITKTPCHLCWSSTHFNGGETGASFLLEKWGQVRQRGPGADPDRTLGNGLAFQGSFLTFLWTSRAKNAEWFKGSLAQSRKPGTGLTPAMLLLSSLQVIPTYATCPVLRALLDCVCLLNHSTLRKGSGCSMCAELNQIEFTWLWRDRI